MSGMMERNESASDRAGNYTTKYTTPAGKESKVFDWCRECGPRRKPVAAAPARVDWRGERM